MNIAYVIRDREAGNMIDTVSTREEAEALLQAYEDEDRRDGTYSPDFYEIVEREYYTVRELRAISHLTRPKFSARYNIPVRTLENWETGVSACPEYTRAMLERIVIEDFPVDYLYKKYDLQPILRRTAMTNSGPDQTYTELASRDHSVDAVLPAGTKLVSVFDSLYTIPDQRRRPTYPDDFTPFVC